DGGGEGFGGGFSCVGAGFAESWGIGACAGAYLRGDDGRCAGVAGRGGAGAGAVDGAQHGRKNGDAAGVSGAGEGGGAGGGGYRAAGEEAEPLGGIRGDERVAFGGDFV